MAAVSYQWENTTVVFCASLDRFEAVQMDVALEAEAKAYVASLSIELVSEFCKKHAQILHLLAYLSKVMRSSNIMYCTIF